MLNNIRNFSKTIYAKVLIAIIIVPFVFWGMGSVFNSGSSNSIVKINNQNISTQDFIDHLNTLNLNQETIKNNLDKNIIEELLTGLISETLLDMEIKNLKISISDTALATRIKKDKKFIDDDGKFSRIKYEKFLLSNNITATSFEEKLKKKELQKRLFLYVSGGIKAPSFLTNITYKQQTGKIDIEYLDLKNNYRKENSFSHTEIKKFINENEDQLKNDYIDFTYIKINPQNLIGSDEFNELFFNKIDEIENKISNGIDFNTIISELKIKPIIKKKYTENLDTDDIEKKIYNKRNDGNIQLLDENEYYTLFKINKINKILPEIEDKNFKKKITKILFQKNKFEFNNKLLTKINENKFNQNDFNNLSNGIINKSKINSLNDNGKFTKDSIKILYSLPLNSYTLIGDQNNNIYLAKISKIINKDIIKNSKEFLNYTDQTNIKMRNNMYTSYDFLLNDKYNIKINEKTLERVKNYFR